MGAAYLVVRLSRAAGLPGEGSLLMNVLINAVFLALFTPPLQQQGQLRGKKVSRGEEGGVTGVRAALVTYSTSHLDRIGCPPPCSLFLSFPFALGRPAPAITTVLQTRPRVAFRCETLKFFQKQKGGSKARARPARARRERASEKSMTTSSRRGTGRTTSNGRVAA